MRNVWRILSKGAPAVTAAILLLIIVSGGVGAKSVPGGEEYHERVRGAIESMPYKIGASWVGADIDTPPAVISLLRPNKIMQRRYRNLDNGRTFSVLIVHCGDVRDMVGHYPPRCYPAHGWTQVAASPASFELAGGSFPATDYRFERVIDGMGQRMRVFGFFVVPTGRAEIAGDYDSLIAASRGRVSASLGAAQIQIIGGESLSPGEHKEIVEMFVRTLGPIIRVIGEGVPS